MKDEIKEIYLSNLEWTKTHDNMGGVMGNVIFKNSISLKEFEKIVENTYVILCDKDYITNLQEELDGIKDNFKIQLEYDEELENKITNLQEENKRLKELCNKYEEEHSTTFNEWKETITDKYQTLKNLQEENESLQKRNKEIYDGFIATQKELSDYATRNEKAIEYIKKDMYGEPNELYGLVDGEHLLNILGGDEE